MADHPPPPLYLSGKTSISISSSAWAAILYIVYCQAKGLEGAEAVPTAWEVRMASKYYKLLFKEYALADLSR